MGRRHSVFHHPGSWAGSKHLIHKARAFRFAAAKESPPVFRRLFLTSSGPAVDRHGEHWQPIISGRPQPAPPRQWPWVRILILPLSGCDGWPCETTDTWRWKFQDNTDVAEIIYVFSFSLLPLGVSQESALRLPACRSQGSTPMRLGCSQMHFS